MTFSSSANQNKYPFSLPELPYSKNDLMPYISSETLDFHHGKHHNTYVVNLNKLLETKSDMHDISLEEIVLKSEKDSSMSGVFNNAAQIWNHSFYWHCMKKNGGGEPSAEFKDILERDFGSFEKFVEDFKNAALTQFGSGWAWLVMNPDKTLEIVKTPNAGTPITNGQIPLMTCDVWEHAYYVDYRNKRPDYVSTFMAHLINWDFVEQNFNR